MEKEGKRVGEGLGRTGEESTKKIKVMEELKWCT